jgi:hypothetical protein
MDREFRFAQHDSAICEMRSDHQTFFRDDFALNGGLTNGKFAGGHLC